MKSLADLNASGASLQYTGTSYQLTVCHNGVQVTGSGTALGVKGGVGMGEVYGPFKSTGAACSGAPAGAAAPIPCKPGEFAGQVNGADVCVKPLGVKDAPTNVTAPASGASGASTSGLANAPPGAVSSSSSTTCVGAECTTTTDYRDSGGASVGTRTEQKTQASFCAENPASSICLPSKSECEQSPNTVGCSEYGTPVAQTLPGSTVSVALSGVSFGGTATCPSALPMTFSVMGHSFTPSIEWASLCTTLDVYVKPVMLVLAVAAAGFIFVGGLKSGG